MADLFARSDLGGVPGSIPIFGRSLTNPNAIAARALQQGAQLATSAAAEAFAKGLGITSFNPTNLLKVNRLLEYLPPGTASIAATALTGPKPNDPLLNYQWVAYVHGVIEEYEWITAITTPSINYEQQSRFIGGKMHHYAGFLSVDDVQMTIYTDVTGFAQGAISKWVRTVRSRDGIYALPSEYQRTVIVQILTQDDRIVTEFHYTGAWPKTWNSYNLQYGSSTILATEVTLSINDVKMYTPTVDERTPDNII